MEIMFLDRLKIKLIKNLGFHLIKLIKILKMSQWKIVLFQDQKAETPRNIQIKKWTVSKSNFTITFTLENHKEIKF